MEKLLEWVFGSVFSLKLTLKKPLDMLLRCCECLTRLPCLKSLSHLEILALSGSYMLKEIQDA